jgi:hypothetical protein
MSHICVSEWNSTNSSTPKTERQVKSKVKSIFIIFLIFFNIKALFVKNLSWQDKQSILHINVTV